MTYLDEEGILADNLEALATLVREKYASWGACAQSHREPDLKLHIFSGRENRSDAEAY